MNQVNKHWQALACTELMHKFEIEGKSFVIAKSFWFVKVLGARGTKNGEALGTPLSDHRTGVLTIATMKRNK